MKSFTENFEKMEKLFGRNFWDWNGFKFGLSAAAGSIISKIKFSLLNQKF